MTDQPWPAGGKEMGRKEMGRKEGHRTVMRSFPPCHCFVVFGLLLFFFFEGA